MMSQRGCTEPADRVDTQSASAMWWVRSQAPRLQARTSCNMLAASERLGEKKTKPTPKNSTPQRKPIGHSEPQRQHADLVITPKSGVIWFLLFVPERRGRATGDRIGLLQSWQTEGGLSACEWDYSLSCRKLKSLPPPTPREPLENPPEHRVSEHRPPGVREQLVKYLEDLWGLLTPRARKAWPQALDPLTWREVNARVTSEEAPVSSTTLTALQGHVGWQASGQAPLHF